jgi:hypothetical protein
MLSKQAVKLFRADGWSVDCESPLEISNGSSKANGWAAEIVMQYYEDRSKSQYDRLRPVPNMRFVGAAQMRSVSTLS